MPDCRCCGVLLPEKADPCPHCGVREACPHCARPLPWPPLMASGGEDCPHCGQRVLNAPEGLYFTCPRCGTPVAEKALYCAHCGTRVNTQAQASGCLTALVVACFIFVGLPFGTCFLLMVVPDLYLQPPQAAQPYGWNRSAVVIIVVVWIVSMLMLAVLERLLKRR